MPLPVEVITTSVSTGGTTQDVTVTSLGTPDMVRVYGVRQTSTGTGGSTFGIGVSRGASDFTTTGCVAITERNAAATAQNRRYHYDDRVVHFAAAASGATELYGTVATVTDGVRISWFDSDDNPYTPAAGETYQLVVELWKATGTSVSVDWVDTSAILNGTVETAVGFEPDVLIFETTRSGSALNAQYSHAQLTMAASRWGGGTPTQYSVNTSNRNGAAFDECEVKVSRTRVVHNIYNNAEDQSLAWTGRSATSHTLTTRDDTGSMHVLVIAINTGSDLSYLGADPGKQSVSGVQSHDAINFQPYYTWTAESYAPLLATNYFATDEASGWASTVFSDTSANSQGTVFVSRAANATVTDNYCGLQTGKARYLHTSGDGAGGTTRLDADLDALTSTGYDADYNTALVDLRQSFTFALGTAGTDYVELVDEDAGVSEDTAVAHGYGGIVDEDVGAAESYSRSLDDLDAEDEGAGVSESTATSLSTSEVADESAGVSETTSAFTTIYKAVDESVGGAESTALYLLGGEEVLQMPKTRATTIHVWEETGPLLIDRVWDDYASDILTPGECIDVTLRVFDVDSSTPNTPTHVIPYAATEVLNASVASHPSGLPDTGGYNFLHRLDPDLIPEGGRNYRVEFTFLLAGDTETLPVREVPVVFKLRTEARWGT